MVKLRVGILILLLTGLVYRPLLRVLHERQAKIAKGLEDARQAAIARDNADADAKKIFDEARAEAARMRQDASVQAENQANGIIAQANQEAKEILASARKDAEGERDQILADLRGQVASIAIAAANKLVGEALDEKKQRALLDEFFSGVKSGKVVVVEGSFKGDAEVTSALPLTSAEQEAVKKNFDAKEITFNRGCDRAAGYCSPPLADAIEGQACPMASATAAAKTMMQPMKQAWLIRLRRAVG